VIQTAGAPEPHAPARLPALWTSPQQLHHRQAYSEHTTMARGLDSTAVLGRVRRACGRYSCSRRVIALSCLQTVNGHKTMQLARHSRVVVTLCCFGDQINYRRNVPCMPTCTQGCAISIMSRIRGFTVDASHVFVASSTSPFASTSS
jgi:hypothetical protein